MAAAKRAVAFGECMLELQGDAFGAMRQGYGGDTFNTAVYLARCGAAQGLRVGYATALGDDALSAGLLQRWRDDEGLDVDAVRCIAGRLPGLYQIAIDADGERRFSYWRDHSAARSYFDGVATTPLERQAASIAAFHFSGISLAILPPAGRERLLALARRLRDRGAVVSFDNNYRPRLWADADVARDSFRAACDVATIALLTLDDELALGGGDASDAAAAAAQIARCRALPCAEVVVKRGAAPTLVRSGSDAFTEVATDAVPHVVDTTAAGDSFAGAYLAARLGGASPLQSARAGNRLAARVVQHRGAVIPLAAMRDLVAA